jgi:hypothetical protein
MQSIREPCDYRFDNFLGETKSLIKKSKAALYFRLIFIKQSVWQNFGNVLKRYSSDGRRNWKVSLLTTQQDDFFILEFRKKQDEKERHSFFWKIISEGTGVTVLSFSLEKFRFVTSCLATLVNFSDIDFPWLGSVFLENIDEFIQSTFGADAKMQYDQLIYDREPIAGNGKPQPNVTFSPISKEEILKTKKLDYEVYKKFFYLRRMKLRVSAKGQLFVFSISDEAEILFEKGDLISFLEIINALRNTAHFYRGMADKYLHMEIEDIRKNIDVRTIGSLDILKLNVENPMTTQWYNNFVSFFSTPFKKEDKLMNFVIMKGNPYFLAQIIDLQKGGSGVYVSATDNSIRISPSNDATHVSTVLKVIKIVQKYVDPNITIAGA